MLDLFVDRDERFETGGSSSRHQRAIPKLFPLHLPRCDDFVPRQVFAQSAGQIMVEQNLQGYGFGVGRLICPAVITYRPGGTFSSR